jgi:hypothetical protein
VETQLASVVESRADVATAAKVYKTENYAFLIDTGIVVVVRSETL